MPTLLTRYEEKRPRLLENDEHFLGIFSRIRWLEVSGRVAVDVTNAVLPARPHLQLHVPRHLHFLFFGLEVLFLGLDVEVHPLDVAGDPVSHPSRCCVGRGRGGGFSERTQAPTPTPPFAA